MTSDNSIDNRRLANRNRGIDLTGRRFGRLLVIRIERYGDKNYKRFWLCQCDCGNQTVVCGSLLRRHDTTSCGCFHKEQLGDRNRTHGLTGTPEYMAWANAKTRCTNPNTGRVWQDYGGRGLKMCRRWSDKFETFLEDIGNRPSENHSVDRKDVNVGYTCGKCDDCLANNWPANCRWATTKQQARNQRTNRQITAFGRTQCAAEWSDETGVSVWTILGRIDVCKGWTMEDAVSLPARPQGTLKSISEGYVTKRQMWDTAEYAAISGAKGRCFNPKNTSYERYGALGTKVCEGWCRKIVGFESFLDDVGCRPSPEHSLDRIDPLGHYSCGHCAQCLRNGWPLNCKWATRVEQANNKRNNLKHR